VIGYTYDKNGRLTSLVQKNAAGAMIASNTYTLDHVGNRLGNTTTDTSIAYQYDPIYRLTKVLYSTPGYSSNSSGKGNGIANATQQQKEFYTYDPVGNRLSSDRIKNYVYNPGNQLALDGGNYTYDKNGSLLEKITADGTTTYAWDYDNRLVNVVTSDGTVTEFAYDPLGRRILKRVTDNGASTAMHYFYDNGNILFEYDDAGTIGNRYTHGLGTDEHLRVDTGKGKYYYHADGLGSTIAVTDTAGTVVQTYQYDSFGNLKDQKNRVKQPYTYTGREWDKEIGLYYYRARYYDPMDGRFISKDPIGFKGGDVDLYGYVHSNPMNKKDPKGLFDWPDVLPSPEYFPSQIPDSYYCDVLSGDISTCLDVAAIVATVSGAGAPADLIIGAASASNTGFSVYVCGPPGSTAERANLITSALSLIPSKFVGKVANLSLTTGDLALTVLRQLGVTK
jgi:RHS repeat-associated protein